MSLQEEIEKTRKQVVTDGYDMSIGEIVSMYKENEVVISPVFQRLFRWSLTQKSRLIESVLLGIPIPPIFVYQNDDGVWELVDGLQRLSTLFEFMGILRKDDGSIGEPVELEGTKYLPSLAGKKWQGIDDGIGTGNQLVIKRTRIRVEILKKESDVFAKYELFQRLNTGGSTLSEQEVRNAIAVMINEPFFHWMDDCSNDRLFLDTLNISELALSRKDNVEHFLKFLSLRVIPYENNLDVNEYLEKAMVSMAIDEKFDYSSENEVFHKTFSLLNRILGKDAFRRYDKGQFKGAFLISVYEALSFGVSVNLRSIEVLDDVDTFINDKVKNIWAQEEFTKVVGAGIRGSTRLNSICKFAKEYFKP